MKNKINMTKISPVILLLFASTFLFLRIPGALVIFTLCVLICFMFIRFPTKFSFATSSVTIHVFFLLGLIASFISFTFFTNVTLIISYFFPTAKFLSVFSMHGNVKKVSRLSFNY